ncbi:MAG: amidohydrolase family protein [Polyangiaceae bacterium]|nr:amidohydrolase family protein [Polyangiaceae bacterium]
MNKKTHGWISIALLLFASAVTLAACRSNSSTATQPEASAAPAESAEPSAASSANGKPTAQSSATWRTWNPDEPIIDSHVHILPTMDTLERTVSVFDNAGIGPFVVKSAGTVGSTKYKASLAMSRFLKGRMRSFANLDWRSVNSPNFVSEQSVLLEQAKQDGIVGIKIFKALGLSIRDTNGKLIPADSKKLAPLFDTCGKLGLIVAWHIADPVAFFEPVTPENERYDELKLAPDWSFHGSDYPSHAELMAAQDRVIKRHPNTVFLLIHFGNNPENIDYVDRLLDSSPNVYIDTSARVPEIGRHPADKVRALFIKHQDRILFGSDFIAGHNGSMQLGSVSDHEPTVADAQEFFMRHWQYFESEQTQIAHPTPSQGNWKVDAIGLPLPVLRKLYVTNAQKLLFSGEFPKPYDSNTARSSSSSR